MTHVAVMLHLLLISHDIICTTYDMCESIAWAQIRVSYSCTLHDNRAYIFTWDTVADLQNRNQMLKKAKYS